MTDKTLLEKVEGLNVAMTVSKRHDDTEYTHFTDEADNELRDLFLEQFEVREIDYQIFSEAIDSIVDAWSNNEDSPTLLRDYIDENYSEWASVYYYDRLQYLSVHNEDEVSDVMKEYELSRISDACAYWYDEQVRSAIAIILDSYLKI